MEQQLAATIQTARQTYDEVTHRNYVADSGAAVVMEAKTGRIVAMASQPTYDPEVWVGGITKKQLARLYSEQAGDPLLGRATQGQFAPGSTWKPIMTVGALNNGFSPGTRLDCSSGLAGRQPAGSRTTSPASYGYIGFDQALAGLLRHVLLPGRAASSGSSTAPTPTDVNAKDPLVDEAKAFGFGRETGIDLPGEAAGRIADRDWKLAYWKAMKGYYCKIDREGSRRSNDFLHVFAHEFCLEGYPYRAGDAVNFAIGQGDTIVTPLQLARAYAALVQRRHALRAAGGQGDRQPRRHACSSGSSRRWPAACTSPAAALEYVDTRAARAPPKVGTHGVEVHRLPARQGARSAAKTGSAEVYGKQSTSWVATYDENYVVVMMVSQGGTGSGTSGPAVRKIWESLYGINGHGRARRPPPRSPAPRRPAAADVRATTASILPPGADGSKERRDRRDWWRSSLDWILLLAVLGARRARRRCWSGRPPRTAWT